MSDHSLLQLALFVSLDTFCVETGKPTHFPISIFSGTHNNTNSLFLSHMTLLSFYCCKKTFLGYQLFAFTQFIYKLHLLSICMQSKQK